MAVFKCSKCGKEVKPVKSKGHRPFTAVFVKEPCAYCGGKVEAE